MWYTIVNTYEGYVYNCEEEMMKGKLFGFVLALLSVATIGVVQLSTHAATPGQVGSAPRCTVTPVGPRAGAFEVNGSKATVHFNAKGATNCKVQLIANSNYAPSMSGLPYDQQTRFDTNIKIFGRGQHAMTVSLPTKSTKAKGCFYQTDLSYGATVHPPVLAYGHGKLNCQKPTATCEALQIIKISRTKFTLVGRASTKGNASVKAYVFTVSKNGSTVLTRTVTTSALAAKTTVVETKAGTYHARVTVKTSLGDRSGAACAKTFTVKPPVVTPHPGVSITKLVNHKKQATVAKNETFTYQIAVRNTGNVDLKNVHVTDTPEDGVTLISAAKGTITNNTWGYTIPSLSVGETMYFNLQAKVPSMTGVVLDNKACVNATEVPGNPDDCDHAKVNVPKPEEELRVCELDTKTIVTIKQSDFNESRYSTDLSKCEETPTVTELPQTGATGTVLQAVGAMALVGASAYYLASRRSV